MFVLLSLKHSYDINMTSKLVYVAVFCLSIFVLVQVGLCEEEDHLFSNSWAIEVKGGSGVADHLAEKHGFINKGLVSE